MPYEKIYYAEGKSSLNDEHLIIHVTKDFGLYVEVGISDGCEMNNIVLDSNDAIDILKDIAHELGYALSPDK